MTRAHEVGFRVSIIFLISLLLLGETLPVTEAKRPPLPASSSLSMERPSATVRYRLDASQSKFSVKAFAGGLLSAFAHDHNIAIRDFSGEVLVTPNTVAPASLQMTVKADSLSITDKVSDKDRNEIQSTMRTTVLEVDKYPDIVFKSTNISADKTAEGQFDIQIWGDVTLHGVTKSIWFKATATLSGNTLRTRGSFALRQSDFKIKPPTAGGGTVRVKDELKFAFDIVGVK